MIAEETTYTLTPAGLAALEVFAPEGPDTCADGLNAPSEAPAHELGTFSTDADGFIPDTADKVDWVLSKVADARAKAARIRENAEKMAREADADAEHLLWQFGPALQDFCRKETEGGRKKSVRLFHGVLGYRTKPAALAVTDERAALEWARVNLPEAVTERVDRALLASTLLQTGEAVEGTALVPAAETFYVK